MEVLAILYLRGLSTGDFRPALTALLGEDAAGLPPTNITRLTAVREKEYAAFRHWKHLRTTNVIESPFATVRLHERVT